jgi:hypothetical protein
MAKSHLKLVYPFVPQRRAGFLIRSRFAEDCVAEGVARGLSQYLILGAGLDTFSYRQPTGRRRLPSSRSTIPRRRTTAEAACQLGIALPDNLTFVPVDFEKLKQAHEHYLKERHDGLAIRHGEQMLRAII